MSTYSESDFSGDRNGYTSDRNQCFKSSTRNSMNYRFVLINRIIKVNNIPPGGLCMHVLIHSETASFLTFQIRALPSMTLWKKKKHHIWFRKIIRHGLLHCMISIPRTSIARGQLQPEHTHTQTRTQKITHTGDINCYIRKCIDNMYIIHSCKFQTQYMCCTSFMYITSSLHFSLYTSKFHQKSFHIILQLKVSEVLSLWTTLIIALLYIHTVVTRFLPFPTMPFNYLPIAVPGI